MFHRVVPNFSDYRIYFIVINNATSTPVLSRLLGVQYIVKCVTCVTESYKCKPTTTTIVTS
jgi:hypothetical protein